MGCSSPSLVFSMCVVMLLALRAAGWCRKRRVTLRMLGIAGTVRAVFRIEVSFPFFHFIFLFSFPDFHNAALVSGSSSKRNPFLQVLPGPAVPQIQSAGLHCGVLSA